MHTLNSLFLHYNTEPFDWIQSLWTCKQFKSGLVSFFPATIKVCWSFFLMSFLVSQTNWKKSVALNFQFKNFFFSWLHFFVSGQNSQFHRCKFQNLVWKIFEKKFLFWKFTFFVENFFRAKMHRTISGNSVYWNG